MYDLSDVTAKKSSPYITYGGPQTLKINRIELVKSKSDSVKAVFHMETQPIKDEGFEGVEGAKGKVGKVACGVFMKHESQKREFFEKMLDIAKALGLQKEFQQIKGDSFEEVIAEIEGLFKGPGKFANYVVFGEEYTKQTGAKGIRLLFPRWNFVEPLNAKESKLVKFDINNPIHVKRIQAEETAGGEEEKDDLPF